MEKHVLVASGCSFTFESWNWPTFVAEKFGYDLINVGMASQGNGLISKKVIYQVDNLLKTRNPEEIMVGIMWSGIDREGFYVHNYPYINEKHHPDNTDGWVENPTSVIPGEDHRNWLITNARWKMPLARLWYMHFHTDIGSMTQTLEHILRVQWYLKTHNVKYFMSTFLDIFGNDHIKNLMKHPEIKYLYDMVDWDCFLDVPGCYEWVKENYKDTGGFPEGGHDDRMGIHPTEFGHKKFSEEVIFPHVKEKLNVNND